MKNCDKCRSGGRVKQVLQKEEKDFAQYICANPRCTNYRQVFAEEQLQTDKAKIVPTKRQAESNMQQNVCFAPTIAHDYSKEKRQNL